MLNASQNFWLVPKFLNKNCTTMMCGDTFENIQQYRGKLVPCYILCPDHIKMTKYIMA